MKALSETIRFLVRLLVVWIVDTLSIFITALIIPGITLGGANTGENLVISAAAALVLGLVNLLLRPIILLLSLPLGFFVVFGIGFLVNAITLLLTAYILPDFQVSGFLAAFIGGVILAAVNTIITGVITIDDDDSFYQGLVERLATRQKFSTSDSPEQGLVMLEIDGLSFHHITKALQDGYMPTLKEMMDEEGYQLSRVDCGLPSQTSACQSGIMFGDNYDIPSFRWFDKEQNKLYVSSKDAAEINNRYANGTGLMRGGSSINNMMDGDAEKSLLTLANIRTGTDDEKKRRARDISLLMLNPYFFTRTLALLFGDAIREVFEYWRDVRRDVQPRLNRLHKGYPFMRAATTVFIRDISAYLATLDIIRGSPSIYLTWPGYDEVAHHSGPWSEHAFKTLRNFDRVVYHLRDIIQRKAGRPYELVILSDHGQSFGATFLQRYGRDLKTFIVEHMPEGTQAMHSTGGDDGSIAMLAMSGELDNMQQQGVTGRIGAPVVKQTSKMINRGVEIRQEETTGSTAAVSTPAAAVSTGGAATTAAAEEAAKAASVTVAGSGNIAQVYFDLYPRKIRRSEMDAAYPGLVETIVQQEGVGFVVSYDDDLVPIVLGKGGMRNLHTGAVTGKDPLLAYGDPEFRTQQVRRIADFPHAGDLIVNSTVFPDGTVAAMEELIGNHGGMGGEQTDAFLFHPDYYEVPETKNSADVFTILNARRGLLTPPVKPRPVKEVVEPWRLSTLWGGLKRVRIWLGLAIRVLFFNRDAFREIARDAYMTGPAILIAIVGALVTSYFAVQPFRWQTPIVNLLALFVTILGVQIAGRALGGKGTYTSTLRVIGFAGMLDLVGLLAFIPPLATVARSLAFILHLLAVWIGASVAHELHGWRSLILPVMLIIVYVLSFIALGILLAGGVYGISQILALFGISPH